MSDQEILEALDFQMAIPACDFCTGGLSWRQEAVWYLTCRDCHEISTVCERHRVIKEREAARAGLLILCSRRMVRHLADAFIFAPVRVGRVGGTR